MNTAKQAMYGTALNRRDLLRSAAGAVGAAAAAYAQSRPAGVSSLGPFTPREVVRIGFVGVGGMGTNHCANLLKIEGAEIRAVCDVVPERVAAIQTMAVVAGKPKPAGYSGGPLEFRRMCDREELDLVYTATPWEWHVPVCVYAMKAGKHAATEVPAAVTVDECWQMVETAEQTQRHCLMMENCCYDRTEMMVLNMVRRGLFGEIVHAEAGYLHDCRALKLGGSPAGEWRRRHDLKHNGNLYPTHGLGPVAWYTNINRGDRLDYITSISSTSKGLQAWAAEHVPAGDRRRTDTYVQGDVNTSLLRTVKGVSIVLQYATSVPRPYSRINLVQGTKGIFRGFPEQICVEGRSKADQWETVDAYRNEFEHPLWRSMQARTKGAAGHGGMDYIEDWRLVQALRRGFYPDLDVYDAATWSSIVELSCRSVGSRGQPLDVPDFTRGKWQSNPPVRIFDAAEPLFEV